jgi:SAM-dependent methyltransferase
LKPLLARVLERLAGGRRQSSSRSLQATFTGIFSTNAWQDAESASGPGSSRARGAEFGAALLSLLDEYGIRSIVDAPCGDFNWLREVLAGRDLAYTGVDIVEPLVAAAAARDGSANRRFLCLDMTRDALPAADLILCRDGLGHLSFADALAAIRNFRRSGSRYLLATTFVGRAQNDDTASGGWRPLNLQAPPFAFPAPAALVDERCTHSGGLYRDKRLGLWKLAEIHAGH